MADASLRYLPTLNRDYIVGYIGYRACVAYPELRGTADIVEAATGRSWDVIWAFREDTSVQQLFDQRIAPDEEPLLAAVIDLYLDDYDEGTVYVQALVDEARKRLA